MSTRSITTFFDQPERNDKGKLVKKKVTTMYKHCDGYPEGWGTKLAEYLNTGKMVDGYGLGSKELEWNGIGCLAASIIAHFKKGVGDIYLQSNANQCSDEAYRYEVISDGPGKPVKMRCYRVYGKEWIFEGTPKQYLVWVAPLLQARLDRIKAKL